MDVKKVVKSLLKKGFQTQASDLYLFPTGEKYELTYRYHHEIESYQVVDKKIGEKLILYLKYLGGMDIAEKRKTQTGSATIKVKEKQLRVRVSSVADYQNRETLVIRFLHQKETPLRCRYILPSQQQQLTSLINKKGLYLFSGPTGAGKSTTMYELANQLYEERRQQIITIEDPVEIEHSSFLQFQVNEKIDLSYEELVKVCLRHRPDVLIVGEIRDQETAKIVVRAALTGHMVFSTIHASNKESVRLRLLDFNIPSIELDQCLCGVIYQELLQTTENKQYGVLYDFFINGEETNWEKSLEEAYKKRVISQKVFDFYH
ncbi:competence type IV pilus ATPase ComGA [Vagococcus fluvialis]|uniref:competence type IV pilus ATPase ComGA n=1 Tax=Vagococcus fluvialis TaxID=2738 RepID=UPI003B5C68EB